MKDFTVVFNDGTRVVISADRVGFVEGNNVAVFSTRKGDEKENGRLSTSAIIPLAGVLFLHAGKAGMVETGVATTEPCRMKLFLWESEDITLIATASSVDRAREIIINRRELNGGSWADYTERVRGKFAYDGLVSAEWNFLDTPPRVFSDEFSLITDLRPRPCKAVRGEL